MRVVSLPIFAASLFLNSAIAAVEPVEDPLGPILKPALKPTIEVVLDHYASQRKYTNSDFPMSPEAFARFRKDVMAQLITALQLEHWQVRDPQGKASPIADRFHDRLLKRIKHHDVDMEVHVIEVVETGLKIPMVVCLPPGDGKHAGVACFSGHTRHGLRDMVLELNSYQSGVAVRLAQAGFVSIAVEKIDTGYLSRDGQTGNDENELTTFSLHWGRLTRAHQLMACQAAVEILAGHPRVDGSRIGATGVSLGGWLSIQTGLINDRIVAIADFGRKTRSIGTDMAVDDYQGQRDLCHIIPGMLQACDRNLLPLAFCPRPMMAGHGRRDAGSHQAAPVHYEQLCGQQYATLGIADRFEYHIHDGGDTMPADAVIEYFGRLLRAPP